jgi:hypothetical protein
MKKSETRMEPIIVGLLILTSAFCILYSDFAFLRSHPDRIRECVLEDRLLLRLVARG